jgi:hypothetical protein
LSPSAWNRAQAERPGRGDLSRRQLVAQREAVNIEQALVVVLESDGATPALDGHVA